MMLWRVCKIEPLFGSTWEFPVIQEGDGYRSLARPRYYLSRQKTEDYVESICREYHVIAYQEELKRLCEDYGHHSVDDLLKDKDAIQDVKDAEAFKAPMDVIRFDEKTDEWFEQQEWGNMNPHRRIPATFFGIAKLIDWGGRTWKTYAYIVGEEINLECPVDPSSEVDPRAWDASPA